MSDPYEVAYTVVEEIDVSRDVVLWNFLDFDHVNHFHTRSYAYCKVLAAAGNARFLEYGVRQLMGLPYVKKYVMWHHYIPPDTIQHISPGLFGGYNRINVRITEREEIVDGVPKKFSTITHTYRLQIPRILKPFQGLLKWYMNRWSSILWEEDGSMLRRRQKVLDAGFKDFDPKELHAR